MSPGSQCSLIQLSPHPSKEKYNLPLNDDTMRELQNRSYTERDADSRSNESLTLAPSLSSIPVLGLQFNFSSRKNLAL